MQYFYKLILSLTTFVFLTFPVSVNALAPVVYPQIIATSLAPSGIEAIIEFTSTVVMPENTQLTQQTLTNMAIKQTSHLLSVFEVEEYTKKIGGWSSDVLGLISLGPMVSVTYISDKNTNLGHEVTYRAVQRVIARRRLIQPGETKALPLFIPRDPSKIYALECTSRQVPEKEFFFYFWNPFKRGCASQLTGVNKVDEVTASLTGLPIPNPETTRPDYASLAAQARARGELRVSVLLGFDSSWRNRQDVGRRSYNALIDQFVNKSGFQIVKVGDYKTKPFIDLVRAESATQPKVSLSISLTESDIDRPVIFAQRARYAYENSDIVVYAGHSGLGGSLNLDKIAAFSSSNPAMPIPIRFPNAYQILYFDSCASYYFYAHSYALQRRGMRKVDVISNGLASYFLSQNEDIRVFVKTFSAL